MTGSSFEVPEIVSARDDILSAARRGWIAEPLVPSLDPAAPARLPRIITMQQRFAITALAAVLPLVLPLACARERLDEVTIHPPARVTIHRDSMGVPHVFSESDAGALFGAGYAMAQDRLLQIEFMVRAARGELAAVLGPELLEFDRSVRAHGYPDADRHGFFEAEPERIQVLY
jgi:acyl-homoserine lactone acylase PvdQ